MCNVDYDSMNAAATNAQNRVWDVTLLALEWPRKFACPGFFIKECKIQDHLEQKVRIVS